jgi:signal transduction histidine kinase
MVRQQKFTVRPVDVPALLQGVLTLARPRLDAERIAVKVACEPGLPHLAGDEILLQQALLNLIANSADAICSLRNNASSPPGPGSKAGGPASTDTIEIRARREGDGVELAVLDSGGGMHDDLADAAWEPFATTKSEGLGIGLPIVRSIVEQHEGQLAAENQPGSGLTVRLRLPVWKTGGMT